MKRNALALILFAALMGGTTYCKKEKKYEKRLEGKWTVNKLKATDGATTTDYFNLPDVSVDMDYRFDSDGDFTVSATFAYTGYSDTYTYSGEWDVLDEELILEYDGEYGFFSYDTNIETYEIIELTKSSLQLQGTVEGVKLEIGATQ